MAKKKEETQEVFDKKTLLHSERFAGYRDALSVLIQDGERLTIDQAEARIKQFMKERA